MFELDTESYASLSPLLGNLRIGTHVMGAVLSGHTKGKLFVRASGDFHTAFFYDNGFCGLVGSVPDKEFAKACLQWLFDYQHQNFFVMYPSHRAWVLALDALADPSVRKVQRLDFEFQRSDFYAQRTECKLPSGFALVPMDAKLMRKVEATMYPWMGGMWKSALDFEQGAVGFCAMHGERVVSLCYSIFVYGRRHAIDILTLKEFRRQGLARAVAVAFVDECMRRGLQPAWDCFKENQSSSHLAQSLGFKPTNEFPVFSWSRDRDNL